MNNIFNDKPLLITLILLVVLLVLLFANIGSSKDSIVGRWIAPFQQKLYSFAGNFDLAIKSITEPGALANDNLLLREEVARLTAELREMNELRLENERLNELLNAKKVIGDYDYMTAKVIGKAPGGWFSEFTVNAGSNDGIAEGMVVITEDGLVGRITSVYSEYSKVMSIIEISSGVPAMMERSRDYCIVTGKASELGEEGTVMEVAYSSSDIDVLPGDKVITSGHGGIYPKGLLIGTVSSVPNDMENISVTSLVDFEHIEEVIIIKKVFGETD